MKPILAILVLTVCVSLDVVAQDIRSKVAPTSEINIIDPDRSIYGVQWGSSEDEFISKFGRPNGYIRLNDAQTAMLYGKKHAFIFTSSKLSGVRITNFVFDWKLSQAMLPQNPLDGIRWQLSNGIRLDMNLADVKTILGESLKTNSSHRYFNSDKARIEIDFARYPTEGERDEAYRVYGVYIRQAPLGAVERTPASERAPAPTNPLRAQIPQATRPSTDEVVRWWQEVRAAAREVVTAMRKKNEAISAWVLIHRRWPDDDNDLPKKERDKLESDLAIAREKYRLLLAEVEVKSYRAPVEDSPAVVLYTGYPVYTEKARVNKLKGTVRMRVEFRSDGTIGDVKVEEGLGDGLDEEAIKVIRQTIFLPSVKEGMFVTTWKVMRSEFHIR